MASILYNKIQDKVHKAAEHTSPEGQHYAAVLNEKGQGYTLEDRPTPKCGPNDVLIEVHSVALNPLDIYQRDAGFRVGEYPAVGGSDVSGIVVEVGPDVPEGTPQPGTKVLAYAASFFNQAAADRGAFQKKVLVSADCITKMPAWLSFDEACKIPLAVATAWNGWHATGAPIDDKYHMPSDKKGFLVWGGSSSVGTYVIQIAKLMGFVVYTTCSPHHHMYVKSIGATRFFDYKKEGVVDEIIKAMQDDGVSCEMGYDAVGALDQCNTILKAMNPSGKARLASAPPLSEDSPRVEGIDTTFVASPTDPQERTKWMSFIFNQWLTKVLEERLLRPSPPPKLIHGGLKSLDQALDELKAGVSGVKLILHVHGDL
jgi:NADPH:quinone reductase-like Zn-dependent oxidoreductase